MVRLLLEQGGAGVDVQDNTGRRPLHFAAQNNAHDIVKMLLAAGASVECVSQRGLTPLDVAAYAAPLPGQKESLDTVQALLAAGALGTTPHPWNAQTALHAAAFLGRQRVVDVLLEHGGSNDANSYLQFGDGIGERARATRKPNEEAQAAAYEGALTEQPSNVAALLRLAAVHARLHARQICRARLAQAQQTYLNEPGTSEHE
mmetsp:Transcript_98697/g.159081  ORF Transcript_98697/g.159081 Transcript_98697/m.159081 type:complete len:203 (-) Transcript_98697:1632-2240(-)